MMLARVIGELTPAAFGELISQVLAKYHLPRPSPDEDVTLEEALTTGVSFEDLRTDIYQALQADVPADLLLPPLLAYLRSLHGDVPLPIALKGMAEVVSPDWTIGNTIHRWIDPLLECKLELLADHLTVYALTGTPSPMPESWFGDVVVLNIGGQPMVAALASQLTDLHELVPRLRRKYRETFPRKHPRPSRSVIPAAAALRLRLEGYKLRDIADIYIARHPSEFPRDPLTPQYRAAKRVLEQRIKKQMTRLRAMLRAFGDT
jgi:hypothetical protein